ncbi:MAG: ABC transporter ATP-binding protein [Spirochaetia bacterium]
MSILDIRNLSKSFSSGEEIQIIFDQFFLSVEKGQSLAVVGESGSGKSTLLNLIAGLDAANDGQIVCAGYDVTKMPEHDLCNYRNKALGFIFQTHFLLSDFSAIENIMMPALLGKNPVAESRERALFLLDRVGLADKKNHRPMQLSGGESQRVAIARALMNSPSLLLADEPTGSLDQRNAEMIQELIFSVAKEQQSTLILVTHDIKLASLCQGQLRLAKYAEHSA